MPRHGGGQQFLAARATLGPRGRCVAPRSLVDEGFARVWRSKFNRLKPLALNLDTWVSAPTSLVIESYSTKGLPP